MIRNARAPSPAPPGRSGQRRARAAATAAMPDAVEVVDGRCQPDGLGHLGRRRPRSAAGGSAKVDRSIVTVSIIDPPVMNGGIAAQDLGPAPEAADPGRPEHLVAGEGHEVHIELADVDRHVRHRLAGVEHDQRADRRGPAPRPAPTGLIVPSRFDWCVNAHDLRALGDDRRRGRSRSRRPSSVSPIHRSDRAGLVAQLLPRHEVRVMLHLGDDDLVARAEDEPLGTVGQGCAVCLLRRRGAEGIRDEIERLGGVAREDQFLGRVRRRSRRPPLARPRRPPWPPQPGGARRDARRRCAACRSRARRPARPTASGRWRAESR